MLKKTVSKALVLSAFASILTACGNLSDVDENGSIKEPVFPYLEEASFNHSGTQVGSWVNWDNVRQIERGMNKDQLQNLIGRPHFAEGWYFVREWDYVFNYRENGEHKICQYKIGFDKNENAQTFLWYPNGCNGNASFTLNGDFLFEFDKDFLTSQGKETVAQLAEKLITYDSQDVRIEGHTDPLGSDAYNLDLSQRRANTVAAELKRLGVNAKLKPVGLGERHPVKHCAGSDENAKACLQPNRRVEIHSFGKRIVAEEAVKKAGRIGPSALYDLQYPHSIYQTGNPYPEKPAMNLR